MKAAIFAAGFATGWIVRSTVESSRGLVVSLGAHLLQVTEELRRLFATEREFLEDLWAEAKARAGTETETETGIETETVRPREANARPRVNGERVNGERANGGARS